MGLSCSPSPLIPLPSRERGFGRLVCLVVGPARPSGLRIESAMTVLMAEMMWRTVFPALWIPAYAGMTVRDAAMTWRTVFPALWILP